MISVFFEYEVVDYTEFMAKGTIIPVESYCKILHNLKKAEKDNLRDNLSDVIELLHYNSRPHAAHKSKRCYENSNEIIGPTHHTALT